MQGRKMSTRQETWSLAARKLFTSLLFIALPDIFLP
jgi:hypothetical protein